MTAQLIDFLAVAGSNTTLTLTPQAPRVLYGWIVGHRGLELVQARSSRGNEETTVIELLDRTRVWLLARPLVLVPGGHPLELVWRANRQIPHAELELLWTAEQQAIVRAAVG